MRIQMSKASNPKLTINSKIPQAEQRSDVAFRPLDREGRSASSAPRRFDPSPSFGSLDCLEWRVSSILSPAPPIAPPAATYKSSHGSIGSLTPFSSRFRTWGTVEITIYANPTTSANTATLIRSLRLSAFCKPVLMPAPNKIPKSAANNSSKLLNRSGPISLPATIDAKKSTAPEPIAQKGKFLR